MSLRTDEEQERFFGTELYQYLVSIREKRRRQQRHDNLLAIILNKNEKESIIEAVEKSTYSCETKEELIEWLSKGSIKRYR